MGAEVYFGSECESLNLLECYYGGSQMDVILCGVIKPPHLMAMKYPCNTLECMWAELGCFLMHRFTCKDFLKLIFHT